MNLKFFTFFLLLCFQTLSCQEVDSVFVNFNKKIKNIKDTSKKVNLLLLEAEKQSNTDVKLSEQFLFEAKKSLKRKDFKNRAFYQLLSSNINRKKGNYAKALEDGLKSYELYQKLKDTSGLVNALTGLGISSRFRNNHKASISYFDQALVLQKDSFNLGNLYNLKGLSYYNLKVLDSAEIYYKKSLAIFKDIKAERYILVLKNNLSLIYLKKNDFGNVLPNFLEYLDYNKKQEAKMATAISYYNISNYYLKKKEYTNALIYSDSALTVASNQGFKFRYAKAIEIKSKVYEALGNYEKALSLNQKFNALKDSIFNIESEKKLKAYELNTAFELERKEYELEAEIQQTKFYLYLFFGSILLASALVILYLFQKNYKNKIKVVDSELEKEKLKKELLDEKVKVSETELKWLIADNQMRLSYLQDFYNQLKLDDDIKDIKDIKGFKLFLKNLRLNLNQQINTQEKLSSLQNKIKDANKGFEATLIKKYPELTKSEREVCFLLRINLSIKEMAAIRNSSVDSIKSIRYRLRKKLGLSKEVELESFIKVL